MKLVQVVGLVVLLGVGSAAVAEDSSSKLDLCGYVGDMAMLISVEHGNTQSPVNLIRYATAEDRGYIKPLKYAGVDVEMLARMIVDQVIGTDTEATLAETMNTASRLRFDWEMGCMESDMGS